MTVTMEWVPQSKTPPLTLESQNQTYLDRWLTAIKSNAKGKLTRAQLQVVKLLIIRRLRNEPPPTYREMQVNLGLSSASQIQGRVASLKAKGVVTSITGRSRSLQLVVDFPVCPCCGSRLKAPL